MLKVPSSTLEEASSEFSLYKRTLFRGRVPSKLLSTPAGFGYSESIERVRPRGENDFDILFLVSTNTIDVVKIKYDSQELVTLNTFFVPFQTRNAVSLLVPSWNSAFAVLVSCEENILLVLEYSVLTQTLSPYRLLKFDCPIKDLLGVHLCVDSYGCFVFLGSLGERHFCLFSDCLMPSELAVQSSSFSFPPCEVVSQDTVGVVAVNMTNKLVRDSIFCEKQDDTSMPVLAILLVDCLQKTQYIYFYTFRFYEHSVVLKCEIPLRLLTGDNISLRNELILWNTLNVVKEEKNKLAIFGKDMILLVSMDSLWSYETTYEVGDKRTCRERMKANSEIIHMNLPQGVIQESNCIALYSSCSCIARRGIRFFAFFEDGSLIGLRQGSSETQATSTPVLLAQGIPNKNIIFADNRNRECMNDDLHGFYFYAVSSTRGLLSFYLNEDRGNQHSLFHCEKLNEVPCSSPLLYVAKNRMNEDKRGTVSALFSSTFGIDSYHGIWELYKYIPLQSLSLHEEQWHEECIKILCLPRNASDSFDSLVVVSFLHSTRVLHYDANENCFLEDHQISFETAQSTVYCICIEDENYLQVHKGGIRLSFIKDDWRTSSRSRQVVDWNPFPEFEILQATSEKDIVAVQWSQHHYRIYLLKVIASSQNIEIMHILSFSCQVSYFCLQLIMEDFRVWIGTYGGTLELYSVNTTVNQLFRFSLDNLVLQLPKCRSPKPDVPNMVTTRIESLICRNERIFIGTRDGYLWILTWNGSTLEICYGKSLGTAPLQLFSWCTDEKHTSILLGLCGNYLWCINEKKERFYFQMLQWNHLFDGEDFSGSCILCPFRGWSEYPTLFLSTARQLALLQVPRSDRPGDIWYSKMHYTSAMTMKIQKYFISGTDAPFREANVNILVVRKATRVNLHSSYEVQAWTCDMKSMLAHLVLPSHTAVTSICVWKQFLLIGATDESILYNDIRIPNTKGRVVLLQLVRTKYDEGISCRFMVNCEFLLPGAVMVVTPFDEDTLLVSCNEHLLAFTMDPQGETLIEIARGETRGLILVVHVEYPFIFVGDRKDSVHIYYLQSSNREIVPICQDEYRKLVVSLAVKPYQDDGQLVFVGDRQAMLHVLWCPFSKTFNPTSEMGDSMLASQNMSLMTCLCSVPWKEIPIHLSLLTSNQLDTEIDVSAILACSNQLMIASMDGTWSQLVFIRSVHAKLLWRLQQVIDKFFRWPVESDILLDGDRLVWFLSSNYTTLLSEWGQFTEKETLQLRHLLYFLEDLVQS